MAGFPKPSHPHAVQLTDLLFHATEAMRAMIARKALAELAGAPKAGRVRTEKGDVRKRSASRSSQRRGIDLSYPAPPRGRPATASGATSFHFASSSASKVRPSPESGGKAVNAALNFERYVTDLDTRRPNRAAATERYVVDDRCDHAAGSRTAFVKRTGARLSATAKRTIRNYEQRRTSVRREGLRHDYREVLEGLVGHDLEYTDANAAGED